MKKIFFLAFFLCCFAVCGWAAIDANCSFSPANMYPGQTSTLTIRLQNSALVPVTSVAFTNVFPNGVFVAGTPNITSTTGGSVTSSNGASAGRVTLSGGMIPASDGTNPGVATITIDVTSNIKGSYINNIAAGSVTAIQSGSAIATTQDAKATLTVVITNVSVAVSYGLQSGSTGYVQGNEITTKTITITNPNAVPLTGLAFTDNIGTIGGIIRAIAGSGTSTCGSATVAITSLPSTISGYGTTSKVDVSGGTIPANASCTVTFNIETSRDPNAPYDPTSTANRWNRINNGAIVTSEGATNPTLIDQPVATASGLKVAESFTPTGVNPVLGQTSVLRYTFTNYNTTPITGDFSDALPSSPAQLVATANGTNTCGGTLSNTGSTVFLTGASIPGATAQQAGIQFGTCYIEFTVAPPIVGTYVNDLPAGTVGTNQYDTTTDSLTADDGVINVNKTWVKGTIYQGDANTLRLTFSNKSTTLTVSAINLLDDLNTMSVAPYTTRNYFRVGNGATTNACSNAVINAPPSGATIRITGVTLAPSATCTIIIPIDSAGDVYPVGSSPTGNHTNTIPIGNITYDIQGGLSNVSYNQAVAATVTVRESVRIFNTASPMITGPLGITRVTTEIDNYSGDNFSWNAIHLLNPLPTGYTVDATPNIVNTCGGTVTAVPGSNTITLNGGIMPTGSAKCSFTVTVKAPALTPPATSDTKGDTIPADAHDAASPYFSAYRITSDGNVEWNNLENYLFTNVNLTVQASAVTINKEFLPIAINGGAVTRVRITFANTLANAVALSGVALTDNFSSTDIKIYANPNAVFGDASGVANSNGCTGGTSNAPAGATSASLSNATIAAGTTCTWQFNVTAYKGGNHINTINAMAVTSNEGITNSNTISATLTVGRQVNVGKGFSPSSISVGDTATLTLYFYNTNTAGNDETGSATALKDLLPVGMHVAGSGTTTCSGGVVSTGIDGTTGQDYVALAGGVFPAESTCTLTIPVTVTTAGSFTNTIAAAALTTVSGAQNPDAAKATLTAVSKATITKAFASTTVRPNVFTRVTFILTNPNSSALTGASFSDTLTSGIVVATPPTTSSTCANASITATPGASSFSVSGATIPASSNCNVIFYVTGSTAGTYPNQTTGVLADQYATVGNPSNTVNLTIVPPPTLVKQFLSGGVVTTTATPNSPVTVKLTLTNPASLSSSFANAISLTDIFPTSPGAMVVAPTPNVSTTCAGLIVRNGSNTTLLAAGDTGVALSNGTINANSSCTVSFDVVATLAGNYTNTTSVLTTDTGTTAVASANLSLSASPALSLTKTCTNPANCQTATQQPGTDLTWSIVVTNTGGASAQNTIVTDKIPTNTDFKLGSALFSGPSGSSAIIEYSSDSGATWTYVPVSAGGGAAAGYDRSVTNLRWKVSPAISNTSPNNTATLTFQSKIR